MKATTAVIAAALLSGTLDILAAIIHFLIASGGANPLIVFQFIASGVLGKDVAYSGGLPMVVWGGVFHYFIALCWTLLFSLVYPRVPILAKNRFITALAYGLFVWLIMNLIVLPLSNVTQRSFTLSGVIIGILILVVFFALPIVLVIGRYYDRKRT